MRTPRTAPVGGPVGLVALALLLPATACTADRPTPIPTVTATVTITADPSPAPSPGPLAEDEEEDQVVPFDQWRDAVDVFSTSELSGKPIERRYLAEIKEATYNKQADTLTVTLDEVTWNPNYQDNGEEDAILNPTTSWKSVDLGRVLVLVDAANGFQRLKPSQFPAFIKLDDARATSDEGVGLRTPFGVWFVDDEPVAVIECYVP